MKEGTHKIVSIKINTCLYWNIFDFKHTQNYASMKACIHKQVKYIKNKQKHTFLSNHGKFYRLGIPLI